ncbi:MAG: sulfotransferase, partial [Gammaproteobacteria bacterium]|nr:sulfotransferase [Gammaproteobacteria bacterium]
NALGFHHEAARDYDRAFHYFSRCNAVRRKQEYYDPVETEFLYDRIIDVFDSELLAKKTAEPDADATPIFIVGLPRSGSTLLEQILASHSRVEGTHELSDLPRVVRSLPGLGNSRRLYPEALKDAEPGVFAGIGRSYIERTKKYRAGLPFFIDKNPNNFVHVGLLHLALPNAVIINATRHPLDSCVGSFKQLFAKGQAWSYDLSDIGEYYLQYERLMAYWRDALPGRVLDVRYEDVVADLDGQVRRILEHCGLPFESACLEFHETERAIKTASSEQVRQPIYQSAVGRWRHYETQLETLIEILEPALRRLPEGERPQMLQKYSG